jgi:hypothetical protein
MSSQGLQNSVIADNWMLQEAADLLSREACSTDSCTALFVDDDFKIIYDRKFPKGALELASLISLLELIVISDNISVLGGNWTKGWKAKVPCLGSLVNKGMIREVRFPESSPEKLSDLYFNEVTQHHPLSSFREHGIDFYTGIDLKGQVLHGSCTYMALSDALGLIYCPHPMRERVLDKTLCFPKWPTDHVNKLNEIFSTTRIKLSKSIRGQGNLSLLEYVIPPFSRLVLNEASKSSSLITTALELSSEPMVVELRSALSSMTIALKNGKVEECLALIKKFEVATLEVERRFGIRSLNEADGPSSVSVFSLPIRIPETLRAPLIKPRYTGIATRLVKCGVSSAEGKLVKLFGQESRLAAKYAAKLYRPRINA